MTLFTLPLIFIGWDVGLCAIGRQGGQPLESSPSNPLGRPGHQHLGLSSASAIASVPCFSLKDTKEKENRSQFTARLLRKAVIPSFSCFFPYLSPLLLIPLDLAFWFPPFLSLQLPSLSLSLSLKLLSLSLTHSHAHTLLSLFLSAEILYLPPMTFLARGGVGGKGARGGGGEVGGGVGGGTSARSLFCGTILMF